jgi:hypothetical protein
VPAVRLLAVKPVCTGEVDQVTEYGEKVPLIERLTLPLLNALQVGELTVGVTVAENESKKIFTVSWSAGQVPLLVVVRKRLTDPAATSAAVGVYNAFNVVAEGEKVPAPPLQIPVVTPVTLPLSDVFGLVMHLWISAPAFALMALLNAVTITVSVVGGQPEASPMITR